MSDVVVDSSVVAKWFVPEPDSVQAERVVTDVRAAQGRLIVLDLVYSEVANVIWKNYRRKTLTYTLAERALAALMQTQMHAESAKTLLNDALKIAMQYDRAVYDSLFLVLARSLGVRGVTADEPLYNTTHADFPEIILLRDWT
jgi:predicted nucleic acid-binding protein